jgi:hypothetical protein
LPKENILSISAFIARIRRNHALEHATIHVLSQHHPQLRVVGRSTPGGFILYGNIATEYVTPAANEALRRLQHGEKGLAVHAHCGTNLATAGILAGLSSFLVMSGRSRSRLSRLEKLPQVLLAATVAIVLAQPVGLILQARLTTSTDLEGVTIKSVTRQVRGRMVIHQVDVDQE